jgi:hypothetical protein
VPSKLRSESGEAKPYRCWGLPDCRCHWRGERPHRLVEWRRISRRKIPPRIMKSFLARRKSLTSACRRSMCSTRKMPQCLRPARKLPRGVAAAAAAGAAAAGAVGEAAGAVAAAEAAAGPGVIAATVRSKPVTTRLIGKDGRVLLDPANPVLFAAHAAICAAPSKGQCRKARLPKWPMARGKLRSVAAAASSTTRRHNSKHIAVRW